MLWESKAKEVLQMSSSEDDDSKPVINNSNNNNNKDNNNNQYTINKIIPEEHNRQHVQQQHLQQQHLQQQQQQQQHERREGEIEAEREGETEPDRGQQLLHQKPKDVITIKQLPLAGSNKNNNNEDPMADT